MTQTTITNAAFDVSRLTDAELMACLDEWERRTESRRKAARQHVAETYDLSEPAIEYNPAG